MPDAYFFGADRFALQARDSKGGLSPMLDLASQCVVVRSVNQAPLVSAAVLAINTRTESLRLNLSAWDSDPEDPIDTLRFFILEPPSIGVLHVQAFLGDSGGALSGPDSSVPSALRAQTAAETAADSFSTLNSLRDEVQVAAVPVLGAAKQPRVACPLPQIPIPPRLGALPFFIFPSASPANCTARLQLRADK